MVVLVQIAPPDFDRMFGALADHTRRDIVRRAINADEGIVELASHYPMSFAAVQKHIAILERAGLVTKERTGRRKIVRTNLEQLRLVRRAIDADEGIVELASHYPMSFAAVQKHIAILERAGLVTKQRVGRRKVVRTNLERLRLVRRLLDQYEELWRGRVDRMTELISETKENDR